VIKFNSDKLVDTNINLFKAVKAGYFSIQLTNSDNKPKNKGMIFNIMPLA